MTLWAMAGFMVLLALCVGSIVYLGIQEDAYDENSEERVGKKGPNVEGVIMLAATTIFLLLGFVWNGWHPGWVVFPIGGILCGIVDKLRIKRGPVISPGPFLCKMLLGLTDRYRRAADSRPYNS